MYYQMLLTIWQCFIGEGEIACSIEVYTEQQLHKEDIALTDDGLEAVFSAVSTPPKAIAGCKFILVQVNAIIFRTVVPSVVDVFLRDL